MTTETPRRRYEKRARAANEQATRMRIIEAAIELHGSIGPAQTSISAIAERADVRRATVYRHFPDEDAIYAACTSHYNALHPPPDLGTWAAIKILRDAYNKALKEPELLEEARKRNWVIEPISGEELESLAKEVIAQPPEVIEQMKNVLGQ